MKNLNFEYYTLKLPISDLKEDVKNYPDLIKNAYNPLVLQQIIFGEQKSFQHEDLQQFAFFGGMFQSNNNPFTEKSECPAYFEKLDILGNTKICVCYDSDRKCPIRIGKFFNCNSEENWCPKEYSGFSAGIIKGCHFNCSIRFHTRDEMIQYKNLKISFAFVSFL